MMHFPGLFSDGWFYLSAGGFIASVVLFVAFLGNYRAAVEAEDEEVLPESETGQEPELSKPEPAVFERVPEAVSPILITTPEPAPQVVLSQARGQAPAPASGADVKEIEERLGSLEGRLAGRLTALESDLSALKSSIDAEIEQGRRMFKQMGELSELGRAFEAGAEKNKEITERLAEISRRLSEPVSEAKPAESQAQPEPTPAPLPEPAEPAAKTEPVVTAQPKAEPEAEPLQAQEPAAKPAATKKTPVWPI